MKAAVRDRFGSPSAVVEIRELDKPVAGEGEVLVRVQASSLNFGDWYAVEGRPWVGRPSMGLRTPKSERLGTDYAGVVEAVGANVTGFQPGDEVFGGRSGSLAEYVAARADRSIVHKPANVTFEDAAAVPVAAITALQGLRDHGHVAPGQKVLVNGASGGVGTYAVQIAKALGAEVTAVCSPANVETARSLGADRVVDYKQDDFTRGGERYDVLLDVAGSRSWSECKRVLEKDATLVIVGGQKGSRPLGPIGGVVGKKLGALLSSRKAPFFIAKFNKPDMEVLRELLESGKLTSVIDRRYELSDIAEALDYLGEGHARGKIVVTVGAQPNETTEERV
ncbi:MAG: NAD(P)-dependent alcohol dehydrogenase [Gaiellaceae bacterium]